MVEVAAEVVLLQRERRAVPVAIESCLANRDDAGPSRQVNDLLPIPRRGFGRLVGMNPDRGEDSRMGGGNLENLDAVLGRRGDRDDLNHPHGMRPGKNVGKLGAEPAVVEMGVGVDQDANRARPRGSSG
jgi:hypothetical protein